MAKAKETAGVDLFGNSTLTPRQLMQQQLSKLLEDTAARTAGMDVRSQGASKMGAAAGALIGQGLIKAGVVEEPEEMKRARKFGEVRERIQADVTEAGVDPVNTPKEYADRVATHFMRAGMEGEALKAIQWGQLQESTKRVADAERAKIANLEADTELKKRSPGVGAGRGEYFIPVQTADGVKAFDARRGVVLDPTTNQPIKGPVVGSNSDPKLQREIAGSKEFGKVVGEDAAKIDGKLDALEGVQGAREILSKGIYTGTYAEIQKALAKGTPGVDKTTAANTEQFLSHIGEVVIPRLKDFGGNDSNEELKYLQKVMAGDITLEDKALAGILEKAEQKIARGVTRLRGRAKQAGLPAEPEAPKAAAPQKPDVESLLKKYGGK